MAGANLGTAYVQIIPSAQGISGSISRALAGESKAAGLSAGGSIAGGIKSAIAKAAIGATIGAGLKKSLSEGAALQQSYIGGLDTLYGSAADKAREYAQAAVEAGVSQNSFAEQAVSFGAALKQAYGGDATKALEAANTAILDMTDNAAKMGTPMQSIQDAYQGFAKQNYTMLDNLKLGYGGTKTEMERLLADAEKLPAAMGKSFDIDNLGDVYEAIHLIQGDLGLTGVAAAEASDTFSGSLAAMKAAYDNLMGNMMLGENVGKSMETLATTASTFLFNNLIPAVGRIFQSLPTAIRSFMQSGLPQFMEQGKALMDSLLKGAQTQLPTMISNLMNSLVNLSGSLRSGASAFVDTGLQIVKSIAMGIINNIPTFIQTAPKIITNLANIINDNAPKIISTGIEIIKALAKGIINGIPVLIANLPQIGEAILAAFQAISWMSMGKLAVKGISKGLSAAASGVKSAAKKVWNGITAPAKAAVAKVKSTVGSIKSHLSFSGLSSKVSAAWNKIKTAMTKPIDAARTKVRSALNKIKGMFPLHIGKIFSGIRLPHFSVSGGSAPYGIGGKGSLPHFHVSWYKKAMENPYMFTKPTLIGAGEAGDEIMYGRKALMKDIKEAVGSGGGDTYYNMGNVTIDAHDLQDVMTMEEFFNVALRAKRFAGR